jgi:hypothetical protein
LRQVKRKKAVMERNTKSKMRMAKQVEVEKAKVERIATEFARCIQGRRMEEVLVEVNETVKANMIKDTLLMEAMDKATANVVELTRNDTMLIPEEVRVKATEAVKGMIKGACKMSMPQIKAAIKAWHYQYVIVKFTVIVMRLVHNVTVSVVTQCYGEDCCINATVSVSVLRATVPALVVNDMV